MYYVASGTIAVDHREMAGAVAALDRLLFRNDGRPIRLDHAADITGVERDQLARLIGLFASHGVVERVPGYLCPGCDGLIEHVPGEGNLWCDECERSVSLRGRGELGITLWRAAADAARTDLALMEGRSADPPASPRTAACIQFVGGDRGGGMRNLLMLPREEKAIREAVSAGKFRDGFTFAKPFYAASVDDLIACHLSRPRLMHLAGHGDDRRLILTRDRDLVVESSPLDAGQVEAIFRNYPQRIAVVFFNTCHSAALARLLAEAAVVDTAIGVPGLIADDKAIAFAKTFYRQLADGLSVRSAFEMAGVHHKSTPEAVRHELFAAPGIDPGAVSFGWQEGSP